MTSLVDAFELVLHAEVLEERLAAAARELVKREGLAEEAAWMASAHRHVARARDGLGDLTKRALRLPELEALRGEHGRALQSAVVDSAESLYGEIQRAGGERSPLLEAIYRSFNLPKLRRGRREDFERFCAELEKRLRSGYVSRMIADPTYEPVQPALDRLHASFADWRSVFTADPLDADDAGALRSELMSAAQRLEGALRQARLIAEAALVPAEDLIDASGIFDKPRRRARRSESPEAIVAEPSNAAVTDVSPPSEPDEVDHTTR